MEFWKAGTEIEDLAKELIANYHSEIATSSICYLYKDKATPSEIEAGQVGVAKRVTGVWNTLTEKDFLIILTYPLWNDLSSLEQKAMLDMALESCTIKLDKDGNEKVDEGGHFEWAIRPYDIQGHGKVISRYGLEVFNKIGECARAAALKDRIDDEDGALQKDSTGEVKDDSVSTGGTVKTKKTKK
jgi:hypothetical protein